MENKVFLELPEIFAAMETGGIDCVSEERESELVRRVGGLGLPKAVALCDVQCPYSDDRDDSRCLSDCPKLHR